MRIKMREEIRMDKPVAELNKIEKKTV